MVLAVVFKVTIVEVFIAAVEAFAETASELDLLQLIKPLDKLPYVLFGLFLKILEHFVIIEEHVPALYDMIEQQIVFQWIFLRLLLLLLLYNLLGFFVSNYHFLLVLRRLQLRCVLFTSFNEFIFVYLLVFLEIK